MIKIQSLVTPVILGLLINPLIANANPKAFDPLQVYRDEIKQTETDASQTLLNQLGPGINDSKSNPYMNTQPSQSSPPTPSNNEKAFSPPTGTQKNLSPNVSAPQTANPWEKPNPWAAQSKVNPWANAPIPGPTPSTPSSPNPNSSFTPISPPNIFTPSQPASMPKKPSSKPTNTTY